jgi:hypothetical protein
VANLHIRTTIALLRQSPGALLDPPDPLQLAAFLYGYGQVEARLGPLIRTLASRLPGPSGATIFQRAYLQYDDASALRRVLDELDAAFAGVCWDSPCEPNARSAVASVALAIDQGRPGMVVAESSFFWLRNYFEGFIHGLEGVSEQRSSAERAKFDEFERRVQELFEARVA